MCSTSYAGPFWDWGVMLAKREVRCEACGTINRVPRYSIRQIPRCGKSGCGKELPEGAARKLIRVLYRSRRGLLFWAILIGFLPSLIGVFTLLERFTSRQASLARNPPSCSMPSPAHGVYRRYTASPLLAQLTIRTGVGENYFAKLVDAFDGTPKMEFFIHGGSVLVASVPVGTFTVKYADGLVWCGEQELFGPDTLVQETQKTFDFDPGEEWTIDLIRQHGGNLRTRYIPRSQF
jgi:hypothetical protein